MATNRFDSEQEFETFSLKNFLMLCLGYWKWFLASIIFFGGVGIFYLYTKQPVYERSEEILVKDQEKGGGIADVDNAFSTLGLFSSNTKVYNELIAITSPAVIFEVVDNLDLTMNYNERKGLKKITLYGTSLPINVIFEDLTENDNVGLTISYTPDGNFTLRKLYLFDTSGRVKFKDEVKGKIDGPAVKTSLGKVSVVTNDAYIHSIDGEKESEERTIDVFKQSRQLAVEKYHKKLKGDLTDQDADVIKLTIEDTSVERADDILNLVVEVYNQRWIRDNNRVALATSKFISERLAVIEKELGDVDTELSDQKSKMGIPDLEAAGKIIFERGLLINQETFTITNMLAMSKFLKEYLEDKANTYSIIPLNTGTGNEFLESQIADYNELLLTRNNLVENSSDDNPVVRDLNKKLAGARNAIMRSTETNINNLTNALRNMDSAEARNMAELKSAPKQAQVLLSVERQQLVMQELYLFLLQKREENELTQSFTAENNRVITPPFGRQKPVAPKKGLIIIVAFIIGAGIPAFALFLAESSNTKIRSKKDLENLPMPFAGEIPHVGKGKNILKALRTKKQKQKDIDRPRVAVKEGERDIPNEAFRVVRSNLDIMVGRNEKTVMALTSFNPGSGKSFVAFNLALTYAIKGRKVLLIDADLRHGSLSNYVNAPSRGLTTYLNGTSEDWQRLAVPAQENANLHVMPIGKRPPNPAELLENGRLETLIEQARQDYDIVLIDCPPINIVVDTQIINQYIDRTIFVVRAGLLEKSALRELQDLAESDKFKKITVLLNGTRTEFSSYHSYGNYEAYDNI